ncbi:MAG: hypothetical protein ABSH24_01630 [Bryobacteraceae bacterium]|jgi:hypothetical protein
MCPACIATAALIAGSASSTGALAALVLKKLCLKNVAEATPQTKSKESHNGQ